VLVLTRRIGESIRIGESVRLTVRAKLRGHITLMLATAAHLRVTDDADVVLLPERQDRGGRRYRTSLLLGDSLRIGEHVTVWIGSDPEPGAKAQARGRQVRIGIDAPRGVAIHREETLRAPVPRRRANEKHRSRE
jgi:sRNA-binding carbon storage regulator CsrA